MIDVAVSVTVHCKFVKLANPAKLLASCDSSKTYAGRQMTPERVGILIVPFSIEVMILLFATVTCKPVNGDLFSNRWADDCRSKISVQPESAVR
jgi:hypothetical protein